MIMICFAGALNYTHSSPQNKLKLLESTGLCDVTSLASLRIHRCVDGQRILSL